MTSRADVEVIARAVDVLARRVGAGESIWCDDAHLFCWLVEVRKERIEYLLGQR